MARPKATVDVEQVKKLAQKKIYSDKEGPKKSGRPPIAVDENLLEKLTKLHLSDKVIADILEIHVDTLHNRFSEKMDGWRSRSKGKIAEVLFDEGINKREPWALKALAQKHLDYSDKVKTDSQVSHNFENISDDDLDSQIKEKISRIAANNGLE